MASNPFQTSPYSIPESGKTPDDFADSPQEAVASKPPAPVRTGGAPTKADLARRASELGVDPELALSFFTQESSGNWNSRNSPKGAVGGMQVMSGTYKAMMGTSDGQGDPWNNMEAGLRYIAYGQKRLGTKDPELLAAGYHAGYDRKDLRAGRIPGTNDGMISTADYAKSVAARVRKARGLSGKSDDEGSRFADTPEDALRSAAPMFVDTREEALSMAPSDTKFRSMEKKPEDQSWFSRFTEAGAEGYDDMASALGTTAWAFGKGTDEEAAAAMAESLSKQSKRQQTAAQQEIDKAYKAVTDAKGVVDTTVAVAKALWASATNPEETSIEIARNAANSLPSLGLGAAGAVTGAAGGAAIGAPVAGVGAVPAALTGAIWGGRGGMAIGTTATELGAEVREMVQKRLQEQKLEPTAQNVLSIISDKGFKEQARNQGLAKGLTIAAVDQLFMGIGGKITTAPARKIALRELADQGMDIATRTARNKALSSAAGKAVLETAKPAAAARIGTGVAATLVDAAGESIGEGLSQKVARGEVDYGESLREGVVSLGQSAAQTGIGTTIEGAKVVARASREKVGVTGTTPSQAAGPLQRATENAATEPERVIVTAKDGQVTGTVTGQTETGVQVTGDDGQVYRFTTGPEGVKIATVPEPSPLSNAIEAAANDNAATVQQETPETSPAQQVVEEQQAEAPAEPEIVPQPEQPATTEAVDASPEAPPTVEQTSVAQPNIEAPALSEMTEPELRARLKYIAGQAKTNGGWVPMLTKARQEVEREINKRVEQAGQTPAAVEVSQPAPTVGTTEEGAGATRPPQVATTKTASKEDLDHLFGVDNKRAKALERIAKGTAFFHDGVKAKDFIKKNGLSETHEVKKGKGGRWDIVAKAEAPASQPKPITVTKAGDGAAAPQNPERTYNVVAISEKAGKKTLMTSKPVTHDEAVTIKSKISDHPARRIQLEEAGSDAQPDSKAISDFIEGKRDTAPTVEEVKAEQEAPGTRINGNTEAAPAASPLVQAMNDLADVRARLADQGQVVDDRLLSRERQLKALVKELEASGQNDELDAEMRGYEAKAETKPSVTQNKVFTEDAAEKARALLRSKLSQLNSGIDPEIMQAGITLAGYHIEKGARTFAAYAQAMVADLGDIVKPYLKSWYSAVSLDPRASTFVGMTPLDMVVSANIDAVLREAGNSSINKPSPDGVSVIASLLGNLAERKTLFEKGFDALDVSVQKGVMSQVRDGIKNDEVFRAIVQAVPVDVMNVLVGTEFSSGDLLGNKSVLSDTLSVNSDNAIPSGVAGVIDSLVSVIKKGTPATTVSAPGVGDALISSGERNSTATTSKGGHKRTINGSNADTVPQQLAENSASPTIGETEAQNGNQTEAVGDTGNRTLERAPSEEVQGTQAGRDAEQRSPEGSGNDAGRAGRTDGAGVSPGGGVGDGEGTVSVPARGRRGKRGSSGKLGVSAERETQPDLVRDVEVAQAKSEAPASDYRITDLTRLGEGGQKTKYRNNVAAIRLLNELQSTGRQATAAEQDVLARYVGWGGVSQAFDATNKEWAAEHAELKELLTPEEWDAANESTQYAHYTSQEIIGGIYDAVKRFGFSGGKVLEPGSGVGNFMGLLPQALRGNTRFTAVERERIAGGIAKALYPNHNVQMEDFRRFHAQDGFFDLAIGNPPFASTTLVDLSGRKHLSGLSIHNYFFAKSIDMLREGGVLAMVVSNSFLDAKGDKARRYIGERAEFLGAIRMPNKAFSKNANTEVTTDIIFLKKRPESEWGSKAAKDDLKRWLDVAGVTDPLGGDSIPLNQYFVDHPEMMLGRMERAGSMYGQGQQPALIARDGQNTADLMRQAVGRLPEGVFQAAVVKNTADMQAAQAVALSDKAKVDVGGHYVEDGKLFVRIDDAAGEGRAVQVTATTKISEKRDLGKNGLERIKALADMRVTVRALLAAEMLDDPKMSGLRDTLNEQYDAFQKEFGYINGRTTIQLFGDDPDFPLLASLEHGYDPGVGAAAAKTQGIKPVPASANKAQIFTGRVIEKHQEVQKADSPADALMISIAERGQIDADYIGRLLDRDGTEVLDELTKGSNPVLFIDPATGGYVLKDAYLSGNVRKKMTQAKAAGMYQNAAALEKVIPEDIPAHEISGKIGAAWVPTETYQEFASEIMGEGTRASVVYVPANSAFITQFTPGSEVSNKNTFGTSRIGADEIFSSLLNSREIKIGHYEGDLVTGSRRFVLEKDATDEANDKAREIKDKFNDWLFSDATRAEKLQRAYNDAVNNYVTRVFDGSMLRLPGKVPDSIIRLRRHQRNAVARIIQDGRALLDHVVGSGKTYTVIAAAMEMKRTGLAKKPLIVVPNHLVKQWAADFYRLYPGANILTATKKDFEKSNRRKFLAKIATGNWDAVIMAHSSYGFIKPDPVFEMAFNKARIDEVVAAMESLKGENDQGSKRTVKQLAKMKEGMENKLASLRDRPMDDLLDFGQLGVDQLFVDEAHLVKNLMYVTKMQNVRGLGQAKGSQRAYDMFIKTHQIYQQNGNGRGVVFATGTPVSNSLAEMYHMLRYLAPEALKDSGQDTFDAWAKTFADVEQVWMQSMSGDGYKASNRMSVFVNTPELLRVFNQVADTVTIDDIKAAYSEENNGKEFPIPALKGGRRAPVSIPRSQAQTEYMDEIAKRAKALEQRKGKPQKGEDNMLSIMGDARKAAMDIRMVRPDVTERDPNGRIAMAARNIFERYQQYDAVKGTQLVFSDMGTPKKHAAKELSEYNELMEAVAPLSDDNIAALAEAGDESAISRIERAEEAQRKIEAKGADWLDAIKAAMRGFSIYDDLKDALVEMGIPENEVAFIHDYNTDDQKAALFRAVNDGKVRVLLGSTEKMGAGTNVQQRAVALHHLDVPWKPSDIEQREGRVIRQGNSLIDQNGPNYVPGFEVEVMAYATQDTLDLFMWQTQEKKLSMIGQLRTGNVGREVDNAFEEMQMSAGEMQAAATSNPYLLEEIQLKDKIKKLERKKRSFEGQKNDIANRLARAKREVQELPEQIKQAAKVEKAAAETLDQISADFTAMAATVNGKTVQGASNIRDALRDAIAASPKKDDGKPEIKIEFNGKTYTSESGIGEAIIKTLGDAAEVTITLPDGKTVRRSAEFAGEMTEALLAMPNDAKPMPIGKIGPFDVEAYRVRDTIEAVMSLNGDDITSVEMIASDASMLMNALRGLPLRLKQALTNQRGVSDYTRQKLEKAKRAVADIEKMPGAGEWDGEAELKKSRQDYKAILKKLAERTEKTEAEQPTGEPAGEQPAFSRLESVFSALEGDGRSRIMRVLDYTDEAEIIRYIDRNFVDILGDLDDAGRVKIEC